MFHFDEFPVIKGTLGQGDVKVGSRKLGLDKLQDNGAMQSIEGTGGQRAVRFEHEKSCDDRQNAGCSRCEGL